MAKAKEAEEREGAQGLSNVSRASNVVRYQLGRVLYHAQEAARLSKDEAERMDLADLVDSAQTIYDARPLQGADESATLGVKGKKAASKGKDETE